MNRWTPAQITKLRQRYGESMSRFAKRLGVSKMSVSFWESGKGPPTGSARMLLQILQDDLDMGCPRPHPLENADEEEVTASAD